MPNGAIHYYQVPNGAIYYSVPNGAIMPNGAIKLLCQLGRYPDHGLVAFHASALALSLVFVFIVHFGLMNILFKNK